MFDRAAAGAGLEGLTRHELRHTAASLAVSSGATVKESVQDGYTPETAASIRFAGPDGRKPTEIAATSGMSKQSVNDALGYLERAGYLERTPHPEERRQCRCHLVIAGHP